MKFAAIALVFALGLSVANAACSLPTTCDDACLPGTGIVGDSSGTNSAACTAGQVLGASEKCDVKLDTGYSDPNSGTTEYSCASDGTTLTSATLTGTACLADYKNDGDGICSACGTGEYSAGDVDNAYARDDAYYYYYEQGYENGAAQLYCDGCKANFYQSAVGSASDGACTACAEGKTLATAPFGGATTECESSGDESGDDAGADDAGADDAGADDAGADDAGADDAGADDAGADDAGADDAADDAGADDAGADDAGADDAGADDAGAGDAGAEDAGQTLATIAECCRDPTCAPSYDAWACIDALEASSATSSDCTSEDGDPVGAFKACGEYVYGTGGFTGEEVRLGALEAGTAQDAALCNLYKAAVTCAKSTSDACLVTFKAMCTNGKPDTCDADCSGAFSIKTGILATTALALLTSVVGLSF